MDVAKVRKTLWFSIVVAYLQNIYICIQTIVCTGYVNYVIKTMNVMFS